MPKVHYDSDARLDVYGDIHVAVGLDGVTVVNMGACKVLRAQPAHVYDGLLHRRIRLLVADEQPGFLLYRTPELPIGKEEIVETTIQISPKGKVRVIMPKYPDL